MTETVKGVLAMIGACTIWGLSPLFYRLLVHVPPLEILSHRALWSLAFFLLVLAFQRRLTELARAVADSRRLATLALAGAMISCNWFLFVWAVQIGRTTESSLGYYIFPLLAVVVGRVIFGERLASVQIAAVALAALAVSLLTVGLGAVPLIALTLAATFALYGVIKKRLDMGPVLSVTCEIALIAPIAVGLLLQSHHIGTGVFGADITTDLLLILSGPLTALPLILFSHAARRLAMATVGLLQYINPTLQFACAVFVFAEPFGLWHLVAFTLIWTALGLYSASAFRQDRARRKAVNAAALSGTAV